MCDCATWRWLMWLGIALSIVVPTSCAASSYRIVPAADPCLGGAGTPVTQVLAKDAVSVIRRRIPVAHSDLLVSAADAIKLSSNALIVDTRTDSATGVAWIPGAIRVPMAFLRANALIAQARVVLLIGRAADHSRLMQAASRLQHQQKGSVRVIAGGLSAWRRAGGKLVGVPIDSSAPVTIGAREFHDLVSHGAVFRGVGITLSAREKTLIPGYVKLSGRLPSERAVRILRRHAEKQGRNPVLIVPNRATAIAWARMWRKRSIAPLLFFIDSGNRYAGYLNQQQRIAKNANKPLVPPCGLY